MILVLKYFLSFLVFQQFIEKKYKYLPIDWALKTKLRLMSPKPFAWTSKLKASEEASGITGFVLFYSLLLNASKISYENNLT